MYAWKAARRSSTGGEFALYRVQFSVEGRDLASAVARPQKGGNRGQASHGLQVRLGGEYKEYLASREQMKIILPLTVVLILMILFALYGT